MTMRSTLLLALLVVGCGDSINAPTTAKPPTVAAAPKKSAAAPKVDDWFYNPAGKRDPFSSFLARSTRPEDNPDAPPLQRWDTDRFVVTGIIWNVETPRALLVDPEGTGHVVRHGTYVGRNWGKVTSISEGGVIVTEEYRMIDGELVVNPVSIQFGGTGKK
jgi:type IV pilus assembly protein PilP